MGKSGNSDRCHFLGLLTHCGCFCSHAIRRCCFLEGAMTDLDSVSKSRGITLPTKVLTVKAMVFPVAIYICESWTIKKGWALKNWCFQIVVLEETHEGLLDFKEIKPVNPKDQSWLFLGRTDTEAEAPIIWPPDVKRPLTGKDSDAGKDARQKENRAVEHEVVR